MVPILVPLKYTKTTHFNSSILIFDLLNPINTYSNMLPI